MNTKQLDKKELVKGLLTVIQVRRRLNCSQSFVYELIADGRLRHYRLGKGQGGLRVSEEQLEEYLKASEGGGPEPVSPQRQFEFLPPPS